MEKKPRNKPTHNPIKPITADDCTALVTDGFAMFIYGLCPRSNHGYLFLRESSVGYGQDYFLIFWSPSAER